jgi:hypothetical protein
VEDLRPLRDGGNRWEKTPLSPRSRPWGPRRLANWPMVKRSGLIRLSRQRGGGSRLPIFVPRKAAACPPTPPLDRGQSSAVTMLVMQSLLGGVQSGLLHAQQHFPRFLL